MNSIRDTIRSVPILGGLGESLLAEIERRLEEKSYARNQVLFLEGDRPRGLFIVRQGAVKVYKIGDRGREQILEVEGPGCSVAELPLFDNRPYPASAAALEDSRILVLPAAVFRRMMESHPELPRAVIASLSRRLRRMVSLVEEVSLKAVRERLAAYLLESAGRSDRFELSLTHQDLAARIGTVREIVSRTMARMAADGAIRQEGRTVVILDRTKL